MRIVLVAVWALLAIAIARVLMRRLRVATPRARRSLPDELVKDPVCQTYIVKSRAVSRADAGGVRYFCSIECARRATGR